MVREPLIPADVDLRGYEFMPLYGDRLFKSETWIGASADAKVAALRLWWHAYAHEVPASSLPDNDVLLAEYAGYGVALRAWQKIKPQVMHGFMLCSDGRLYHEHLSVWALEAWAKRLRDRQRKAKWRNSHANSDGDGTGTGRVPETGTERGQDGSGTADRTGEDRNGQDSKTKDSKALSGVPPDGTRLNGNEKSHVNGNEAKAVRTQIFTKDAREILEFLNEKAGKKFPPTDSNVGIIVARLRQGFTPVQIRQVVAMKVRKWKTDPDMREYLRPETLFGPKKFSGYVGELVDVPDDSESAQP